MWTVDLKCNNRSTCPSPWIVFYSERNLLQGNVHLFAVQSDFRLNTAFGTIDVNLVLNMRPHFDELQSTSPYFSAVSPQHIGSRKGASRTSGKDCQSRGNSSVILVFFFIITFFHKAWQVWSCLHVLKHVAGSFPLGVLQREARKIWG